MFCFEGCVGNRDLHVLTHSCPTRRASDLTPMHVGGLMLLDRPKVGRSGFAAHLRAHLAQRLPKAKALRRILQPAPFALDHPHWADATEFDLDQHLSTRSEEHTSALQSLMRLSYAVLCLKKKKRQPH